MRVFLILVACAVLLTGCLSPSSPRSAGTANAAGAAQKRGDWAAAVRLWKQAIEQENGFWQPELARKPRLIAIYYYELGRSLGVVGQYDEGEKNLQQAFRLDERFGGPKGMDLVELARLNHARGDQLRAASFFDQFLPKAEEVAEGDPAGYLALLKEGAVVYRAIGKGEQAAELEARADKFSTQHPNITFPQDYGWTPYKTSGME